MFVRATEYLVSLIKHYQAGFNPNSLLKYFEVCLFRIIEQETQITVYQYISECTKLFGMQLIVEFVMKYLNEEFIIDQLITLLTQLVS